ncbi:hypothetical protein pphageT12_11 [Pseudomonas phage pphageT12]|uniref:Uncharacterized protein n=1 Tax=Pseudomonas phage phiB1_1 TaxID=2755402 RepID=A0A7D7JRE6_9CAUD|nr:hypothetical protein phiB1_1_07 [Pseudomonas phage phiB1_1]UAW53644.1 hypothetical protein pphageB21_11 [Pseudomonas phage pphageB21]UAW53703.1 hypothetical protein pphageT21_11 [Pseudomonas phage pphageT21]UAW53762.1 hypothetical protein pphageT12_11 [Pseudomonas phage pphageT12]UAW53823.1 hypothetical protein pphageBV72_11 [Pseudomonas phage pphageBV72]
MLKLSHAECDFSSAEIGSVIFELWQLKAVLGRGDYPAYGICYHAGVVSFWDELGEQLFRAWPEFSGDSCYPVPGGMLAYKAARVPVDLLDEVPEEVPVDLLDEVPEEADAAFSLFWTGEYGSARIRLLNFCIMQLELLLKERVNA